MYGISRLAAYYPFRIISTFPVLRNLKGLNISYSVARYVKFNIVSHSNSDLHNERMIFKFLSLILLSNVCDIGKEVNGNILLFNPINLIIKKFKIFQSGYYLTHFNNIL